MMAWRLASVFRRIGLPLLYRTVRFYIWTWQIRLINGPISTVIHDLAVRRSAARGVPEQSFGVSCRNSDISFVILSNDFWKGKAVRTRTVPAPVQRIGHESQADGDPRALRRRSS